MNPADRNSLRLKLGEDHKGWVLRAVRPRQVVLEKGQQIVVLELPQRDVRIGGLPSPTPSLPLSATPSAATSVVKPSVPTPSRVNPFAADQNGMVPPPLGNSFAGGRIQKARLR